MVVVGILAHPVAAVLAVVVVRTEAPVVAALGVDMGSRMCHTLCTRSVLWIQLEELKWRYLGRKNRGQQR